MIGKILNGKLLIFAAFLLTGIVFAGTAGASTLTVDDSGGADYMRIQDAIDNASAGDTVLVYSGTYFENVNVSKPLVLRGVGNGAGAPVMDGGGSGSVVVLSADGVMLDGFVVITNGSIGLSVTSSSNYIKNNIVQKFNDYPYMTYGIYISYSNNNILSNNTVNSNNHGIYLLYSNNNTLSNNTAYSNKEGGIVLWDRSDNNTLINNNAINNLWGIYLLQSSNNLLISNIANENKGTDARAGGFRVQSSSNNNKFINNTANFNSAAGFRVRLDANNNTIIGNTITLNAISGISVDNSNDNIINSNIVSLNTIGIRLADSYDWMSSGSHNNLIYNNFFNNTNNLFVSTTSTNNTWNITKTQGTNIVGGSYLGGNFWAHPNGTGFSQICLNNDTDGICDSPYTIDENNTDYLPLTGRYVYSGILQPINADGGSIFKSKRDSIVPVKFQLLDTNGNFVTSAVAEINLVNISSNVTGTDNEQVVAGEATTGNRFVYDSASNEYVFNLATWGLSSGTWQIEIRLDDETLKYATISVK